MESAKDKIKYEISIMLQYANDIIQKQNRYKVELHNYLDYSKLDYVTGFSDFVRLEQTKECEIDVSNRLSESTDKSFKMNYLDGFTDAAVLSKVSDILIGLGSYLELEDIKNVKEDLH